MISIIIPTLNEEAWIEKCLKSVLGFKLPNHQNFEIIIVDGNSQDKTVEIVKTIASENDLISIINNPKVIQSVALNLGFKRAKGEWILRLDAHSIYPANYLILCYETTIQTKAQNVGGLFIAKLGADNYQAHMVQALTTHKFGVGGASFRTSMTAGEADTVPYGFFNKNIFERIGYLDERLVRAQDYEFNRRIIACGGKIWRNPEIHVYYYNQPTMKKFLLKQMIREAPYNAYMWYLAPYSFTFRHAITGIFSLGVIGGLIFSPFNQIISFIFISVIILYFLLALLSSFQQAKRYNKIEHIFTLPLGFFSYHFLHGLGLLYGIFKLIVGIAPVQKIREPWKGYGSFRIKISNKF